MDSTTQVLSCYAVSGASGTATKALFWVFHPAKKLFRIYTAKDNAPNLFAKKASLLIVILVMSATALSQSLNGVYLTKADFESNLLSNPSSNEGDWLKVDFNKDLVISRNGSLTRFKHHECTVTMPRGISTSVGAAGKSFSAMQDFTKCWTLPG